jgi:cation-transporting ATPase E
VAGGQTNYTDQVTSRPIWEIIKANVFTRFNALLGVLCVLVLLTGSLRNALFGIALIANSLLGIGQELHAKRKLDSLAVLHAPTATVLRDGTTTTIPVAGVVLDDVIRLQAGDQIPAVGPVLESAGLEIDESNLTGESDPVGKATGDGVCSGTAVVAGTGWFQAAAVGADATAQRLSSQARVFTRAYSEVQYSTNILLRWLTWIVVLLSPVAVWTQYAAIGDTGWRSVVIRSAAGLVGLVPEGLVVLTTLAFLLAAVQLTRQQALVQELPAVEGLARVDVICLDKTGTLTQGEIAYESCRVLPGYEEGAVRAVLGALVHDPQANATAQAIAAALPDPGWTVTDRVPFSSARKWSGARVLPTETGDGSSVTLFRASGPEGPHGAGVAGSDGVVTEVPRSEAEPNIGSNDWVLGAPDVLLDPTTYPDLTRYIAELSEQGRRVVLLAQAAPRPTADRLTADRPLGPLTPAALIELSEVIRPDAADTLAYFATQGVAVKVISGDNPVTVAAVARRVGLPVEVAVDARTLPEDPAELAALVPDITVFGRVTPAQKRALVRALHANGHTVAMTGDGVNDVLALKDADIGIAMGNGAQATKAVAQLVLLDSRFSHLPQVLAEGRRLIGNVERVASLFVAKNVMSAFLIIAVGLLGATFPFIPLQLSLVSTLTIGIPAAILALAPNSRRYTPGFLSRVLALSLPAGATAGLAAFLAYAVGRGDGTERHTLALAVLLVVNFWLLGALARPYNWWKILVVATMAGTASLAFIVPSLRTFFELSLPHEDWPLLLIIGGAGAAVVEAAYRISRRFHRVPVSRRAAKPGRTPGPPQPANSARPPRRSDSLARTAGASPATPTDPAREP